MHDGSSRLKHDTVGQDGRLRPRCCHLANWTKHKRALPLILAHSFHCVKSYVHSQKQKFITYCTAVRGGPSHGTENFVKFEHVLFRYASGQTNRQTDRHDDRNSLLRAVPAAK